VRKTQCGVAATTGEVVMSQRQKPKQRRRGHRGAQGGFKGARGEAPRPLHSEGTLVRARRRAMTWLGC
jgi:hypothetical protein